MTLRRSLALALGLPVVLVQLTSAAPMAASRVVAGEVAVHQALTIGLDPLLA